MPLVDSFSVLKNAFPFQLFLPVRYFHKFSEISIFADVDLMRELGLNRVILGDWVMWAITNSYNLRCWWCHKSPTVTARLDTRKDLKTRETPIGLQAPNQSLRVSCHWVDRFIHTLYHEHPDSPESPCTRCTYELSNGFRVWEFLAENVKNMVLEE